VFGRFYEAIADGGDPPVSHVDALRVTRVMDAVFESCREAEPMAAPARHLLLA
jgi:predicted dehydrogenase